MKATVESARGATGKTDAWNAQRTMARTLDVRRGAGRTSNALSRSNVSGESVVMSTVPTPMKA
jgi:hypothetical protein